ncbi:MAG: HTTM domain-containing protein [Sandaracinaceae bacterium]|nr:HTTM domain-containing protein [Sandaracinaceae bacterium]
MLHTWGWAMSMLDSYQHHYLLSIVLLALVFFPALRAEDALVPAAESAPPPRKARKKDKKSAPKSAPARASLLAPAPTVAAWAYVALAASIAVVYAYTAFSKTADEWLASAAMQRVLRLGPDGLPVGNAEDPVALVRELAAAFGFEGTRFWWLLGHSVVVVQIVCAAGYLLAPFRDVARSIWTRAFAWVALATALSFHLGAEHMELKIGWFSWYMIFYAFVYLLPERALVVAARFVVPVVTRSFGLEVVALRITLALVLGLAGASLGSWPIGGLGLALLPRHARALADRRALADGGEGPPYTALVAVGSGAVALAVAGYAIDLPGAPAAGVALAVALGAGTVALLVRSEDARAMHPYGVGAALAALVFFASIRFSDVRYDFYRNVGGDHRRRGELLTAYQAYLKANLYAPEGEGRHRQAEELREELERRGELPASD